MSALIEEMASHIAETMNGGKFKEDVWYNDTARASWRKAVEPYAEVTKEADDLVKQMCEGFCKDYPKGFIGSDDHFDCAVCKLRAAREKSKP